MRKGTEIYSIFGQIEAVVAGAMVAEGKANKIEPDMIPATALFDDSGRRAQFAIILPLHNLPEHERRVRNLYA